MPKSRNNKDHKKRLASYKKRVENDRRSYQKQIRALYEQQQRERLEKQVSASESQMQEAGIDGTEFELEDVVIDDTKLDTSGSDEVIEPDL